MQILQIEQQRNNAKPDSQTASKAADLGVSIILTVCSMICFLTAFELPCPNALLLILSAITPAALCLLLLSRAGKYVNMGLPLLFAVYFAAAYPAIWKGCLLIANSIITKIDRVNLLGILTYDTGPVSNPGVFTAMALVPAILIMSWLIVTFVKHRLFAPVIMLTLPFILAAFYFRATSMPAVALMIITWAALISGASRKAAAWVFLITAVFGVFVCLVLPYSKYAPSPIIYSARQRIGNAIESLRYNYGIKKTQIDQLPNGNLKNVKTLSFTDEVVMQVKMQKPSAVYLKGFIGSVYSGSQWSSLPETVYGGNNTGLFEWLAKNQFYPQSQISSLCGAKQQSGAFTLSVHNIALESKYIYAPYEALPVENLSPTNVCYAKDAGIFSSGLVGTRTYSFQMVSPLSSDYGTADLSSWVKDNIGNEKTVQYLKYEATYRAFVYKNDLTVPTGTQKTLQQYFSKETIASLKNKDTQSVIDFLRKYYLQKFSYSADIKQMPAGSDFIADFLKTGSGYDIHFATLSVMLLRSAGIPARYVEGYYLPHSYVDIYSETENPTLDVKDSFAHAWAEIYVDGVGWIPAELTPGYYNADKDSSKKTGKDEAVSKKDKNYYSDPENALTNDSADKRSLSGKSAESNPLFIVSTAVLLIVIVLAAAAFFIRKAKRERGFYGPDKAKAALRLYVYAAKLLKCDGIKIDRHSAYESSEEISREYDALTGMSFREFLSLVYKARFGPLEPDAKELAFMQSYTKSLARQIYIRQGFGKKLILKLSGLV